uniref:Uncharacterized protein n=1 Tax=Trichogramma kaykai TaxID=54128 RepID=A0ABD2XHR9_9HYME
MAQSKYKHQNIETHRALELLSDFYGKLIESQEKYLVIETERLIRLLKSKFFQALIDIREYYQITALDSSGQITYPYFDKQHLHLENTVNIDTVQQDNVNEKETIAQISSYENLEVSIERGELGFGFSIAGGTDNQHENGDNRIYITKISHNGSAALSGLLKTNDILEKVNDTILSNVRHIDAVNALKTSRNPVKLLNLNHCEAAQDLLCDTISRLRIDVAILCEQYKNLAPPNTWLADADGQAAIWVQGGIPVQERPARVHPYFTWARIGGIFFFSVYAPRRLSGIEFSALLANITEEARGKRPLVVAGDFNAWSTEWGCRATRPRAPILLDSLALLDAVLLNTGVVPTFNGRQGSSVVDLTFVSESLAPRVLSWKVSGSYTHSDHQAIVFEIEDAVTSTRPLTRQSCRWNARTLDADRFSAVMSGASVAPGTAEDMASSLMYVITGACDASMTKANQRRRREPVNWWTAEIADLRRSCLRARRLFQRSCGRQDEEAHGANYASTRRLLRAAIKTSKRREQKSADVCGKMFRVGANLITIRRKNITQIPIKIDLEKINGTFGFSVSGGRNNQHQSGDSSIFITKITEGGAAEKNGRIKIGQKIIGVQSSKEYINFENVTHEEAVEALKVASKNLRLFVIDSEFKRSTQQLSSKCDEDTVMISSHESLKNLDGQNDTSNLKNLNSKNNEIYLKRNVHGFGFNIIGGENNEGIFVSSILKDGPAWTDGKLKVGDQIIIVNERDFKGISHEDAANYLKGCDEIRMSTEHDIAHYDEIKRNLCQMKSLATPTMKVSRKLNDVKKMLVKCLFDYDPEKDDDLPNQGLHFHFGDILFVINASDEEWWQAKKVQPLSSIGIGIIPGKKRWERKQRAKERCVKFEESTSTQIDKLQDKKKKNYTFSRRFPFMKNKEKVEDVVENEQSLVSCYTADGTESKDSCDKEILYRVELPYMDELTLVYVEKENEGEMVQRLSSDDEIIPYLEVIEIPLKQRRPIIILGPIKDQINDDLISEYPEKFESCIPHTTRPKKPDEADGHDYHFVHSREIMENDIKNHLFIEAGQYNGNLYGTSISSIAAVASRNKHCILDVSENAIKRLYSTHFYPIILLIKLKSPDIIK